MMTVRNEIKAQIVRAGYTMQEVVDRLHEEYGWSDSVSTCRPKLQRESIRYKELIVGSWPMCLWGRGGAAERVGYDRRICDDEAETEVNP